MHFCWHYYWQNYDLLAVGALLSVCRKKGRRNQRFILTQMHRRRRHHNGTRNALCCHRRRLDNLHDFSVSAQQSASRIIHSSFDLDGRHSTASPFIGLHLDVSRPEAFPSSPSVARSLFILPWERSALEILFHLASARAQTIRYIGNIHSHAARVQRARPSSFARARSSERIATLINQSRHARDKSPRVIY